MWVYGHKKHRFSSSYPLLTRRMLRLCVDQSRSCATTQSTALGWWRRTAYHRSTGRESLAGQQRRTALGIPKGIPKVRRFSGHTWSTNQTYQRTSAFFCPRPRRQTLFCQTAGGQGEARRALAHQDLEGGRVGPRLVRGRDRAQRQEGRETHTGRAGTQTKKTTKSRRGRRQRERDGAE